METVFIQKFEEELERFREFLRTEERAGATISKYGHDLRLFFQYLKEQSRGKPEDSACSTGLTKEAVIGFKEQLLGSYSARSVNSMLAAVNAFLKFTGWQECQVKFVRIQKQLFCEEERELKKTEYNRLVEAARQQGKKRLEMVLQTLCSMGLRISELKFVTVEAVREGKIQIFNKGKNRIVFLPGKLKKHLCSYIRKEKRASGPVFVTRNGRPLDRSNVWREMKRLKDGAGVPGKKIYPHGLRHLFARTFYELKKDVVKLADVMGHSSIETTRLYTSTSGGEYRRQMEALQLVL